MGSRLDAERLQEVVDIIPDVLFRCYKGEDGRIYWSLNEGGLAREFHLTTAEIEGKSLEELFEGGASQPVREHFEAAFRGETKPFINEIGGRYFKHFPQPIRDKEGHVVEVVGFISEVTDLVKAEQRLQELNADLDAFAHSASHDLRMPLTVIANLLAIARSMGHITPDWDARMGDAVDRMGGIIDSLLAFSRSGTGAIRPTTLDISRMAQETASMLQAGEPGRKVTWAIEPNLSARGDEAMMRIVLDNLLGNAWKYTRDKEPGVIRVSMEDGLIVVEDNGRGVSPGDEERIFRPFQQGTGALPGNGIGLATVRRIIERHGGIIRVDPEHHDGASFKFSLGDR